MQPETPEQAQEWKDISNEDYRKYTVVSQMGAIGELKIVKPKGLKEVKRRVGEGERTIIVTDHLILDEFGEQHLIEAGWMKISFKERSNG